MAWSSSPTGEVRSASNIALHDPNRHQWSDGTTKLPSRLHRRGRGLKIAYRLLVMSTVVVDRDVVEEKVCKRDSGARELGVS